MFHVIEKHVNPVWSDKVSKYEISSRQLPYPVHIACFAIKSSGRSLGVECVSGVMARGKTAHVQVSKSWYLRLYKLPEARSSDLLRSPGTILH